MAKVEWLPVASVFAATFMSAAWGWFHGYRCGVKDTERRWSGAVKRYEAWLDETQARLDRASSKGDDK